MPEQLHEITYPQWVGLKTQIILQDQEDSCTLEAYRQPIKQREIALIDSLVNIEDHTIFIALAYDQKRDSYTLVVYPWTIPYLRNILPGIGDKKLREYIEGVISQTNLSKYVR